VLDTSIVDEWVKTEDPESFVMARRLIREEGILCGGSSGSALVAALQKAKELKKGQRCVVIIADSVRNYMSKFLSDDWMLSFDFLDPSEVLESKLNWWTHKQVRMLQLATPCTVLPDVSCGRATEILRTQGFDQLPVVDRNGTILGVVTEGNLLARIATGKLHRDDPVSKVLYRQFKTVSLETTLGKLSTIFDRDHFAIVTASQQSYSEDTNVPKVRCIIVGVVTRVDLLNYIVREEK